MNSSSSPGLPGSLAKALAAYDRQGLGAQLQALYQRLPATACQRQGRCCGLLPPVAPLEMLAWLVGMQTEPAGERSQQAAEMIEHFLTNAGKRQPCPWSRPGACAIYEQRFLACRSYGLWSVPGL